MSQINTMPDISMCRSTKCPNKLECYRYMAKPSMYQAYADFYKEEDSCDYFWELPKNTIKDNRPIKDSNNVTV